MSTIWFTADLHLGHVLVARQRGFGDDTAAHDEYLAACWDAVVRPDDVVKVLGDLCIGQGRSHEHALEWIAERPGTKDLIWGNHDAGHPMHRGAHKDQADYLRVFRSAQQSGVMKIGTNSVMLNHLPFTGDHTPEDRYPAWRPVDAGQWLIHGHTHSPHTWDGRRQIHVGLDAHALTPAPYDWVRRLVRG
jgi:calcineurin-like phosphoesterase family protein